MAKWKIHLSQMKGIAMKARNRVRMAVRVVASVGLLFVRFYFGPTGVATALVDGLVLTSIWVMRSKDSETE